MKKRNKIKVRSKQIKKWKFTNYYVMCGALVVILLLGIIIRHFVFGSFRKTSAPIASSSLSQTYPISNSTSLTPTPTINPATYNKLSDAWNLGTKSFSDPKLAISFDYPSYFDLSILDFKTENEKWADNHKMDPNVRQPLYPSSLDFTASVATPTQWLAVNCENKMTVSVWQYDNPNLSVYDFISNSDRKYSWPGYKDAWTTYKKGLKPTDFPKPGSFVFKGTINGPSIEEVYFQNNGKIFQFILTGNCGEEAQYSTDAEAVFNNILRSIKYL